MKKVIKERQLNAMLSIMVLSLMMIGFFGLIGEDGEYQEKQVEEMEFDLEEENQNTIDYDYSYDGYIPYPPDPTPFTLIQPDGTEFEARMVGERMGAHVETLSGYSIVKDENGWWTFAEKDENGVLIPTDYRVGNADPGTISGLQKHLFNDYPEVSGQDYGNMHRSTRAPPINATWKGIAIMLNFTDEDFDSGNDKAHFEDLLNGTAGQTMRTYYQEVSYGQFDIEIDVVGPFQSSHTLAYYGADTGPEDSNPFTHDDGNVSISEMAREAVELADPYVNFSHYDIDSDYEIDALFIIHASWGQEQSHISTDIWSHKGFIFPFIYVDGVRAGPYSTEPENGKVGVFGHEFGHVLGLPDLYDRDYSSEGIGQWGIMAGGSWNGGGNTPAHFCAWSKVTLGWVEPIIVTSDVSLTQIEIPPVENHSVIYKVWAHDPAENTSEYFLIENRQKIGYDSALPGDGILIWHIDETMSHNDNESHYLVDLEEADGDQELETYNGPSESTDPWENTVTGFRDTTNPDSDSYNGSSTYVWVWNISEIDPVSKNMSLGFNEIYSGPTGIYISNPISNTTINPGYDFQISDIEFPDEDIGSDSDGNNGSYVLYSRRNATADPWSITPSQVPESWIGGVSGVINCTALPGGFWDFRVKVLDEEGHLLYTPPVYNITVPENNPPLPDAGPDNSTDVKAPIILDGSGSWDDSGYIFWYNWTFGDGTYHNSSDPQVVHIFNDTGIFTVILNVTDSFGNWANDTVNITVSDTSPPVTTLIIDFPKYQESEGDYWNVTSNTQFTLSAVDNYSGVNFTWYIIDGEYFEGTEFKFIGYEDGLHNLSWGSRDNVGNNETAHSTSIYLDNTPPDNDIYIGFPKYRILGTDYWNVTDTTSFTLIGSDLISGVNYTWYQINSWIFFDTSFTLEGLGLDDGLVTIYWSAIDNVGNSNVTNITINLDTAPPKTNLTVGTPRLRALDTDVWNVTIYTEISITEIGDNDGSGINFTWYTIDGMYNIYSTPFTLAPGMHTITWGGIDNLGLNETDNTMDIFVDNTPPITTLSMGTPIYGSMPNYLNLSTEFNLTATDGTGSGVSSIWYRIDSGIWNLYNGNFTVTTPGSHTIYYNSTDNFGQSEVPNSSEIFVDNLPPDTTIFVGNPNYGSSPIFVNSSTIFNLTSTDSAGSGVAVIWYKIDDGGLTPYTGNFTISTPGAHTIYYNSTDNLGQDENQKSLNISVDDTPPDSTLIPGNPNYAFSPTYANSTTNLNITATDGAGSGVAGIWYKIDSGIWNVYTGDFKVQTPGSHTVYFNSTDNLGHVEDTKSFDIFVDDNPPNTTITIGNPKLGSQPTYVNQSTSFNLTATDETGSGVATIWYKIESGTWSIYIGNFTVSTPGHLTIFYKSYDRLGQEEIEKSYDIFVDDLPPDTDITVGNPSYGSSPIFINSSTNLNLTATDGTGSGVATTWYKIDSGIWNIYTGDFSISSSGYHTILYKSYDELGQEENEESYEVFVEDIPPDTTITVGNPNYDSQPTYVNSSTDFNLSATDGTGSGVDSIWYKIDTGLWILYTGNFTLSSSGDHTIFYYSTDNLGQDEDTKSYDIFMDNSPPETILSVGDPNFGSQPTYVNLSTEFSLTATDGTGSGVTNAWYKIDSGIWTLYSGQFTVSAPGSHSIHYYSVDNLGQEEDIESYDIFVDNNPPNSTLSVGIPNYGSQPTYVDTGTDFNLTATDETGSGVASIRYKIDSGTWTLYTGNFSVPTPGDHIIYYYSTDNLGHDEDTKSFDIFVDNILPDTTLNIGNPKYGSQPTYVNSSTEFNLTATDGTGPGVASIWYKIDSGEWMLYTVNFTISTAGAHTVYYNSTDILGQNEDTESCDIFVDDLPPTTSLTIGNPSYGSLPTYVNSSSSLNLSATDGAGSGVSSIWYKIDSGLWTIYTGNFTVSTSGTHIIYYYSTDNLGRAEDPKSHALFVDNTLPDTTLFVGEPSYSSQPTYVNSSTEYSFSATDGTGSGVALTWYKIDSGLWNLYSGSFTISAPGAHIIYYNTTDNLGQVEITKSYDIFVDDLPPSTDIYVDEPKYREKENDHWNVTVQTEFSLSSMDQFLDVSHSWYTIDGNYFEGTSFNLFGNEDGVHDIAWGSVDLFGNNETGNTIFVVLDTHPPISDLSIGLPKYRGNDEDHWNVTDETPFSLTSQDLYSGVNLIWYKIDGYFFVGTHFALAGSGDGLHTITYGSVDNLGNNVTQNTVSVILDNTAPTTDLDIGALKFWNDEGNFWFATQKTDYNLTSVDEHSGVYFSWYTIDNDKFAGTGFDLQGYDDGLHTITWGSLDHLGNNETANILLVKIDSTPPIISIEVGSPKLTIEGIIHINSSTPITLISSDSGVGHSELFYSFDGGITYHIYESPFTVPPGTTAIIYSGNDRLGNNANESTLYLNIDIIDTDGDGLDDPWDPDDDNDGLLDTEEDVNGNGIVDEGETDPRKADTDGDGKNDKKDKYPLNKNKWKDPTDWEKIPVLGGFDRSFCITMLIIGIILLIILIWLARRYKMWRAGISWEKENGSK